jgi:hypothetical protein
MDRRTFLVLAVAATVVHPAPRWERVTRIAVVFHPTGAVSRCVCHGHDFEDAQNKAIAWLARTMRPQDGDEMVICYPEFDIWREPVHPR